MAKKKDFQVGIVAPSSKVPEIEFALGVDRIREAGFTPVVHPQCASGHLFFAGSDEERALAFYGFAKDPRFNVVWSARGGYGAVRILPLLDRLSARHGVPPRKLLVGFSDSSALLEYVRTRWGWETLHAPMPGLRKFCALKPSEWNGLVSMIRGGAKFPKLRLKWLDASVPGAEKFVISDAIGKKILMKKSSEAFEVFGELVGGNLSVWSSLIGTPYAGDARDKLFFLEDVDENLYRVDRMVQQMILSGAFQGVRAVVLGNFMGCNDVVPRVLSSKPKSARELKRMIHEPKVEELEPLREVLRPEAALAAIFGEVTRRCGVPVAIGVPSGHGPEKSPLPLGAEYSLSARGDLVLSRWNWKGR